MCRTIALILPLVLSVMSARGQVAPESCSHLGAEQLSVAPNPHFVDALASPPYTAKYHTVAHDILKLESECMTVTPDMYRLLDSLIDEAHADAAMKPGIQPFEFFSIVDRILVAHNFVFPYNGLVTALSTGLRPATFSPDDARQFLEHGPNFRRRQAIETNQSHIFYVVDCDLSSILYVAIAQTLNLPVYLNEIPGHNFVRWSAGDLHFNWDSNYGDSFSNAMYTEESHIPQKLSGTAYLVDMRPEWVMGYWHDLRSKLWTAAAERKENTRFQDGLYENVLADLKESESTYTISGDEKNELAWFLATCPLAKYRNSAKAIPLAQAAVNEWTNPNWMDTLAAAYAEAHQWDRAAAEENSAKTQSKVQLQSDFESDESWPDFDLYVRLYGNDPHTTYAEYKQTQSQPVKSDFKTARSANR